VNFIDPSGAIPYIPDCQESLCKVELLSTRAGGVEYAGHFAIAHVDRKGASGVIEAVPDPGLNWQERIINQKNLFDVGFPYYWNPVRHPYSTDAGILISQIRIGSTPDVIREFKETFQADSLLVAEGAEACNLWKCLQESMMQVEKNEIGYMLLGPNSNSAAISVLRKCQLPWRAPARDLAQITGRPHPGWILYLLGPLANTRIDRKDNYEFWLEITRPQLIQH
jgi:hypothetical protein